MRIINFVLGNIYRVLRYSYSQMVYGGYRRKYDIDKSFKFMGNDIALNGEGRIKMGKEGYIGNNCIIYAHPGATVTIGDNCAISHFVAIYSMERVPDQDFSKKPHKIRFGDITIGNNCWIGVGVFIKHGIRIGDNCVIGAHSIVTKDIPSYSVAVGSPAKVIKSIKRGR